MWGSSSYRHMEKISLTPYFAFLLKIFQRVCRETSYWYIDGLVQYYNISIANAPEVLQSCTKPSICSMHSKRCSYQIMIEKCFVILPSALAGPTLSQVMFHARSLVKWAYASLVAFNKHCLWLLLWMSLAWFLSLLLLLLSLWYVLCAWVCLFNTLRPRRDGRILTDDIFKCIFFNENLLISSKISLTSVPWVLINNIPALFQIMAWRRPGDKPLS